MAIAALGKQPKIDQNNRIDQIDHLDHDRDIPPTRAAMETIAAADAKTNFGALLDKAQQGPVTISRNGRPVAVVMSAVAFEEQQQLKLELLRQEVRKGLDDLKRGKVMPAAQAFADLDKELED